MSAPEPNAFLVADLRAGSIDSGAALMVAEVVLRAVAELPGGADLIAAAVAHKARSLAECPGHAGDAHASLMVMREVVDGALNPVGRAAA